MGELRVFAVSGEDLMDIWNTHFLSLSFIYWIFHYDEIAHEIEKTDARKTSIRFIFEEKESSKISLGHISAKLCNIVNYITLMPYGHERCDGDY